MPLAKSLRAFIGALCYREVSVAVVIARHVLHARGGEMGREGTALAFLAHDLEPGVMTLQCVFHDREAKPGAAELRERPASTR